MFVVLCIIVEVAADVLLKKKLKTEKVVLYFLSRFPEEELCWSFLLSLFLRLWL